jgi:5-methylcytosine-specific restriction endonuclease McrA
MKKGIHLVVGAFLLPLGTPFCRGITFSSRAWCLKMFMKPYAESFYKSKQWQDTRNAYASSVGGLCEMCKANGLYNAGEIVHHIVHITPQNINDPNVTLDWNNLMLVCRECHAKIHTETPKRYVVDAWGRVIPSH